MVQKGQIKEIPLNSNKIKVRIPIFETSTDNREAIFDCLMCVNPGSTHGYAVGDIVYVDFENNDLDHPVVVGKLYRPKDYGNRLKTFNVKSNSSNGAESNIAEFVSDLKVYHHARLPEDTIIGDLSYSDILTLVRKVDYLEDLINSADIDIKIDGGLITSN